MNKSHVLLKSDIQNDGIVPMKYNYGFGKTEDDATEEEKDEENQINLAALANNLYRSATQFRTSRDIRHQKRNAGLNIPKHIDYVRINFLGQFAVKNYFSAWYKHFGLEIVEVTNFGSTILFAVVSEREEEFQNFLSSIDTLVENARDGGNRGYSNLIHYIDTFELLSSDDIIKADVEANSVLILKIPDLLVNSASKEIILKKLFEYLENQGLQHSYDESTNIFEIYATPQLDLEEIIDNFDIFLQVTSSRATLVRPDSFNLSKKEYGFNLIDVPDFPVVGIIDSGISFNTPLAPAVIADNDLNITNTPVHEDNVDGGQGHGTAVAALVSLGSEAIAREYLGDFTTYCKLLPIKIIDEYSSYLSINNIISVLKEAKSRYQEIKIFTLTVNFQQYKKFNENYSNYAYSLDRFSYENDCLIFISTGNNFDAAHQNNGYHLPHFGDESTNLCVPAESLNNMTVGACAESFRKGDFFGISNQREYPTMFSRKGHYNDALLKKGEKKNKLLFKPDMIMAGGDYCFDHRNWLTFEGNASMVLLSADPRESFYQNVGTSFAAPLAANVAARIQKLYPTIRASSIKSLMLNHCTDKFVESPDWYKASLIGHGHLMKDEVLFSSENKVSLIIEDSLDSGEFKIIPIKLPDYLVNEELKKRNGILQITATLCFQFLPVKDNQLGYCPVHIAFGFFKNHTHDLILQTEEELRSKLKSSLPVWSQNARFKTKPIPYSNVQKQSFPINVDELIDEKGIFKLGIHCLVHPQLRPGEDQSYLKGNKFSIAITIEETLKKENLKGKLYDELIAINEVELLGDLDQEAYLEA